MKQTKTNIGASINNKICVHHKTSHKAVDLNLNLNTKTYSVNRQATRRHTY